MGRQAVMMAKYSAFGRSEEHTSELQSLTNFLCRLLLEKKKSLHLDFVVDLPRPQRDGDRRGGGDMKAAFLIGQRPNGRHGDYHFRCDQRLMRVEVDDS